LIELLETGSEADRVDAVHRLGYAMTGGPDGDRISRAALEKAAREQTSKDVRALTLPYFWRMPDDAFEVYFDRLLNDSSNDVKVDAIVLADRMAEGIDVYLDQLRQSKISDKYSRDQLLQIANDRRARLIEATRQLAAFPGVVGDYGQEIYDKLRKSK
jgi:hypothetical protein